MAVSVLFRRDTSCPVTSGKPHREALVAGHSGSHREVTALQPSVPQAHPWFQKAATMSWGWVEPAGKGTSSNGSFWNESWSTITL